MDISAGRLLLVRTLLIYLALQAAVLGLWALPAPRSFYDSFPGFGRSWVAIDGPYNEHLIRDVGALNLAMLVLLVAAALRPTRLLVQVAFASMAVWALPHLVYHVFNTDGLSGGDVAASLGGLALYAALPLLGLAATVERPVEAVG